MTDPALIPTDVVHAVPEGGVVYGMQLPIQSQSTLYVADWEKASGPVELAPSRSAPRLSDGFCMNRIFQLVPS